MKILKGQIELKEEDLQLISNVFIDKKEALSAGTWVQEIVKFDNGNYIELELWVTDEETETPYLTVFLKDAFDSTIADMDIEASMFNNIEELFGSYKITTNDEEYKVSISKAQEFICSGCGADLKVCGFYSNKKPKFLYNESTLRFELVAPTSDDDFEIHCYVCDTELDCSEFPIKG